VTEITADQVGRWLDEYQSNRGEPLSPVSRNNFLAYLNAFFNFALKKGYSAINPVERNERYVDMADVLIKWLEPYRQTSGPVVPPDTYAFTKLFNRVRQEAGLKDT